MNDTKFPQFLEEMLKSQYGNEITQEIINNCNIKRKTTLRVNTIKSDKEEIKTELDKNGIKYRNVSWSNDALIIENADEKKIETLDIYESGKIYLQSLSSMLPPIILNPKEEVDILDMAAAPGGKTTQIAALTNNNSHITACELNSIRAEKLKYNIEKQGAKGVYIMKSDSRMIDDFFSFDSILLDSPCSGSGTLNLNDPKLEKYFTKKLIEKSTKSQKTLIEKAVKILKPGCEMVYSTCSILKCENEDIVNSILSKSSLEIVPIEFEGMEDLPLLPSQIPGTICVCPNEQYEGFFVAKIRKIK